MLQGSDVERMGVAAGGLCRDVLAVDSDAMEHRRAPA